MKSKLFLIVALLSQLVLSCKKGLDNNHLLPSEDPDRPLKVAVVSDIHYMDPSLLDSNAASGAAFQNYLNQDPKLLQYSDMVFRKVMAQLLSEKPDILLVP